MLCAARPRPPPVAWEPADGVEVEDVVEVLSVTVTIEVVALGVPSAVSVAGAELVTPPETVEVVTSWPVPQGIAEPSGWVLSVAGTILFALSVIVNRPVQTLLPEAAEVENW